jgi:hypothetical protein
MNSLNLVQISLDALRHHGKSPLDAPPIRAGMNKACRLRQHGSCNVGVWGFGVVADASIRGATIWFGRRSPKKIDSPGRGARTSLRAPSRDCPTSWVRNRRVGGGYGLWPPFFEFFAEVFNRASGGGDAVSARETRMALPKVRKQLWVGESGEDGSVASTVGDQVTAEVSKKYIPVS